ncbi:MAG: UvrD-helicase domain-containing protein [Patescibacteria group bacterium]|nr:UvrD-helicase domain-containing protein [Patescibacteria group bacterium]
MSDLLKDLNKEQKEVVTSTEGPLLVLAGAGSGKTKALTHRVAYLVAEKGVLPESILAITFTNKAASEMSGRIDNLIKSSGTVKMGTFHSICAQILRREAHHLGYPGSFVIFDQDDSKKVIKQVIAKLGLSDKKIPVTTAKNLISGAKNELIGPEEYANYAESFREKSIVEIYKTYQKELEKNEAMDFDDLLMLTVKLFQKFPEVLKKYQNLWKYILIDEYQDTNHAQYLFVRLLSATHGNICVIGDDDQSIYSFRGANFQNILDFEKDWPKTKVVRLEKNYRSTKAILTAAQSVIERNTERSKKTLWTENETGRPIEVYEAASEEDEAGFVARKSEEIKVSKGKLSDIAVFYRTNAQSRAIEEQLLNMRIPYKIVGGVRFYERKEIKDALAWLRVASGANDWIAFERSLTSPPSGIGKLSITRLREYGEENKLKIKDLASDGNLANAIGGRVVEPLSEYFRKIKKIQDTAQKSLSSAVELAIKTSGLIEHLSDGSFENEERIENLKELLSVVKELENVKDDLTLESFLEEVALISDIDNYNESDEGITLMTLHTSKGLEYKYVFIVGLEENIFPHSRSMLDASELEEERRLFYVGMTRAREELYLVYARRRLYFGGIQHNSPSRFIAEIPPNLLDFVNGGGETEEKEIGDIQMSGAFKVGDEVEHEFFGRGKILEINDDEITADFNVYGKKTVSLEYAPVRKV